MAWLHQLTTAEVMSLVDSALRHVPEFNAFVELAMEQTTHGDVVAAQLALQRLPDVGWFEDDWRYGPDTSGYVEEVRRTLAPMLSAAVDRPVPALLPPLEDAITTVCEVLEEIDDQDGEINDVIEEFVDTLQRVAAACAPQMSSADRTALADWLWDAQAAVSEYSTADLGADVFIEALGTEGLTRYRALVDAADAGEWRVGQARQRLAVLDRDPAAVIDAFGGTLDNASSCLAVVGPLREIGQPDTALEYARRGFTLGPVSSWDGSYFQLTDILVEDAIRRGDNAEALELRRQAFQTSPGKQSYIHLREAAGNEWPKLSPIADELMQERCPREWEDELLDQGRIDEAWRFVNAQDGVLQKGHTHGRLLLARGQSHPEDVLPFYQVLVDDDLMATGRAQYESAASRLVVMKRFADAAGQAQWFDDYLAALWEGARRRPACREIFTRHGLVPASQQPFTKAGCPDPRHWPAPSRPPWPASWASQRRSLYNAISAHWQIADPFFGRFLSARSGRID